VNYIEADKNPQHTYSLNSYNFKAALWHASVDTEQAISARKTEIRTYKVNQKSTYKYTYMLMPTKTFMSYQITLQNYDKQKI